MVRRFVASRFLSEGPSSGLSCPHLLSATLILTPLVPSSIVAWPVNILTIETTCDETAAAIVTDRLEVLASVVASQDDLHRRFGGVVPEIASRAHVERILPVIDEALRKADLSLARIDAVAVANTPGLGRLAAGGPGGRQGDLRGPAESR